MRSNRNGTEGREGGGVKSYERGSGVSVVP